MHEILQQQFFPPCLGQPQRKNFAWRPISLTIHTSSASKFQRRDAPSKSRTFNWIRKFSEYGTMQNLNSKGLMDTYSGRTESAKTQALTILREVCNKFACLGRLEHMPERTGLFLRRDFND